MTQQETAKYIFDKVFLEDEKGERRFSFASIIYVSHLLSAIHRIFPFLTTDEVISTLGALLDIVVQGTYDTDITGNVTIQNLGVFKSSEKHRLFQLAFSIVLSHCSYFGLCYKELLSPRESGSLWMEYEKWIGDISMGIYEQ